MFSVGELSRVLISVDLSNLESRIDLGEFELGKAKMLRRLGRDSEAKSHAEAGEAMLRLCAQRSPRNRRVTAMLTDGY